MGYANQAFDAGSNPSGDQKTPTPQDPGYADKATYAQATPHGAIPARLWAWDATTKKFLLNAS